jgi:hypothetical protein
MAEPPSDDDGVIHIKGTDGEGHEVEMTVTDPETIEKLQRATLTGISIAYTQDMDQFIASKIFPTVPRKGQPGYQNWEQQQQQRAERLKQHREEKAARRDDLHAWIALQDFTTQALEILSSHRDNNGYCNHCTSQEEYDNEEWPMPWPCDFTVTVAFLTGYNEHLYTHPQEWRI